MSDDTLAERRRRRTADAMEATPMRYASHAMHPHRCGSCELPWASTNPEPEACPFCGFEGGTPKDGAPTHTAARAARSRA